MTVLFKPILALHIINFSSCRNYWGGGVKTICPPPPPPGSTSLGTPHELTFVRLGYFGKLKKWWPFMSSPPPPIAAIDCAPNSV